jgi:hypothetical protein
VLADAAATSWCEGMGSPLCASIDVARIPIAEVASKRERRNGRFTREMEAKGNRAEWLESRR